jgi:hypothetical protein
MLNELKLTLMKSFTPTIKIDQDSPTAKLAAQDWERREARAAREEAAETRQKNILQALELAPHFDLHRLPQNFWVAVILPSGEMPERQRGVPAGEMPKAEGAQLPPWWGGPGWGSEITGCTDLYHISDHVLFFRSNLPEQEIRENIDLSFLPF